MVEVGKVDVPAHLSSAAMVRHDVADDLASHGVAPALIDDAVLVVSELVANAVRHGASLPSGSIAVRWTVSPGKVRLWVTDGGSTHTPQLRPLCRSATSGRGLAIVDAMADSWGVESTDDGTAVWADVSATRA